MATIRQEANLPWSEGWYMSFFLIGKGPDGSLKLLSERVFETRADAMSELSRITSEESFTLWDHEVVVGDLQGATPVLLVRPASAKVEEPVAGPEPAETVVAESLVIEEPGLAQDAVPSEAVEVPSEAVEVPSEAVEVPSEAKADVGPSDDLKEALRRTTESLAAEGIVPPESIGPAEEPASGEDEVGADDSRAQLGDAAVAEGPSEVDEDAMVVEADAPAWPWATSEQPKSFDLDALEEPGEDDGSLVRAPGDEETISTARPVILGAYESETSSDTSDVDALLADLESDDASGSAAGEPEEAQVPPIPVPPPLPTAETDATDGAADEAPATDAEALPEGVAPSMSAINGEDLGTQQTSGAGSDFVDLPPVPVDPIDSMTCDDCVYTDTCPNKGQRDPATCGSFQWK